MFNAFFREKNWICAIQSRFFIVQTFFKNFFTAELNCASTISNSNFGINLSPMGFWAIYTLLVLFISKNDLCNKEEVKAIVKYVFITGIIYHVILLWSYLFMFNDEFTESNQYHMQNMTSHYAGPFYIGTLLLLLEIIFNRNDLYEGFSENSRVEGMSNKKYIRYIIFSLVMVLLPSYPLTYQYLLGYRKQELVRNNLDARVYYMKVLTPFTDKIGALPDSLNKRVLFLTTTTDGRLRSYLHYFTTPLSVFDIYKDEICAEDLIEQITVSESNYLFILDSYDDTEKRKLKKLGIETNILYEISWKEDEIYLNVFDE